MGKVKSKQKSKSNYLIKLNIKIYKCKHPSTEDGTGYLKHSL